jgi:hypothetical protein
VTKIMKNFWFLGISVEIQTRHFRNASQEALELEFNCSVGPVPKFVRSASQNHHALKNVKCHWIKLNMELRTQSMFDKHSTTELSSCGMSADAWRQRFHTSLMLTIDSTVAKEQSEKIKRNLGL